MNMESYVRITMPVFLDNLSTLELAGGAGLGAFHYQLTPTGSMDFGQFVQCRPQPDQTQLAQTALTGPSCHMQRTAECGRSRKMRNLDPDSTEADFTALASQFLTVRLSRLALLVN